MPQNDYPDYDLAKGVENGEVNNYTGNLLQSFFGLGFFHAVDNAGFALELVPEDLYVKIKRSKINDVPEWSCALHGDTSKGHTWSFGHSYTAARAIVAAVIRWKVKEK